MQTDSQLEFVVGAMWYFKLFNGGQQMQCHGGNFTRVSVSIADRKSTHYHICISNRFHLKDK